MTSQDEEEIVANLLLAASRDSHNASKNGPKVRSRALRNAIELMLANERENLPISHICSETGVSWRTLDRAF